VATVRCRHAKGIGHVKVIAVQKEPLHVEVISRARVIVVEKVNDQKHAKAIGPARVIVLVKAIGRVKVIVLVKVTVHAKVLDLADRKGVRPKRAKVDAMRGEQASVLVSARPARVLVDLAPVAAADLDLPDLDRLARVALAQEPKAVVVEAKSSVLGVAKMTGREMKIARRATRTRLSKQPFEVSPAAEDALPSAVPISFLGQVGSGLRHDAAGHRPQTVRPPSAKMRAFGCRGRS
jgi:hypothetical protein